MAKNEVLRYNGQGGMDMTTGRLMDPTMQPEELSSQKPKTPKKQTRRRSSPKTVKLA